MRCGASLFVWIKFFQDNPYLSNFDKISKCFYQINFYASSFKMKSYPASGMISGSDIFELTCLRVQIGFS